MRLATIVEDRQPLVAVVEGDRVLPLRDGSTMRRLLESDAAALARLSGWADSRSQDEWLPVDAVELGPVVPDPGAIFTIGANYATAEPATDDRPERPLVFGKLPASVVGPGASVTWDRSLTANVDPECELGVVIGRDGTVFGYTCINDVSSRDPWLDGDQWLLGKSMPGFCPTGPWIVTADALDPADVRLGGALNGVPIQDGRTSQMRFSIGEIILYLRRHVTLRPGDLIATGTPARLMDPPGPDRHLEPGDVVTVWIEGIGELTTTIG